MRVDSIPSAWRSSDAPDGRKWFYAQVNNGLHISINPPTMSHQL